MFARTVTASFDVTKTDELRAFGASIRDQVASFPGLLEWRFVADVRSGSAVSFSVFESEDVFLASKTEIDALLAALGRFLTDRPTEILGEVLITA